MKLKKNKLLYYKISSTFLKKSLKIRPLTYLVFKAVLSMTKRLPIPPNPTPIPQGPSSHLQQPRGPAEASRLLSVSEAKVGSVDIEDTSLTDGDDDGC